jgi:hypothetical protein
MPAPVKALGNMRVITYEAVWKTETIGWLSDVDVSGIQNVVIEQKVGELADVVIDRVHRGVQGTIKTTLHEVITERIRQLMPWAAATGAFAANPTADLYSEYVAAGPLILHPRHLAANVTTDDITFVKAFPRLVMPKSMNNNYATMEVTWNIYMDQTALATTPPTYVAWYRGPAPT